MFSDAFLLDTEAWEWRQASNTANGVVVGHTAVLGTKSAASASPASSAGNEENVDPNTMDVEHEVVMFFGGQVRWTAQESSGRG